MDIKNLTDTDASAYSSNAAEGTHFADEQALKRHAHGYAFVASAIPTHS